MCRSMRWACVAVVLAGWSAGTGGVIAGDRTGEQILKELDALEYPTFPRGKSADSLERLRSALEERLVTEFPDSPYVRRMEGNRRQREMVGKPFDLEFADAITGAPVSVKKLRGKVVVIDFWATWCGPCVAEMPKMKELYAKREASSTE